jgi:hypothetical protein
MSRVMTLHGHRRRDLLHGADLIAQPLFMLGPDASLNGIAFASGAALVVSQSHFQYFA